LNEPTIHKAVLYARVSTGRQAEKDLSIPDQIAQLKEYCSSRHIQITGEFIDPGRSGTNDNRPMFREMIAQITQGIEPVDAIIVHSLSRAFRSVNDLAAYVKQLREVGTRLISITQELDETPYGDFMRLVQGFVDQQNSAENSKHVKRTQRANARLGFFNGSRPPYGYRAAESKVIGRDGFRKILVIDEEEAKIIRKIYDLYEGVMEPAIGMKKIVERLNDISLYRGRSWLVQEVHRILSDTVYCGTYLYGARNRRTRPARPSQKTLEDDGPIEVSVPPIIDKDRFNRIKVTRSERSPRKRPPLYVTPRSLLTGLCRCGFCSRSMIITTGKNGRYRYLKCTGRNAISNTVCSSPNLPLRQFERVVIETITETVLTEDRILAILDDCRANVDSLAANQSDEVRVATRHLHDLRQRLSRLYKLVEEDKIRIDATLSKRIEFFQDGIDATEEELSVMKVPVAFPKALLKSIDVPEFRRIVVNALSDTTSEEAKKFMHLFVKEIKVYRDECTISGENLAVLEGLLAQQRELTPSVPSFMRNWRKVCLPIYVVTY
jgi:site-specific DNA recombinase